MENKNLFIQEIQGVFFDSKSAAALMEKWLKLYFSDHYLDLPDRKYLNDFKIAIQKSETTADLFKVKLHLIQTIHNYLNKTI
jgi:hypothetical protein